MSKLDMPEHRTAVDPGRVLSLAQSLANQAEVGSDLRTLCIRLNGAPGQTRLTGEAVVQAVDLLLHFDDVPGLVAFVEGQFAVNTTWSQTPQMLAMAADLLLRAAVQTANRALHRDGTAPPDAAAADVHAHPPLDQPDSSESGQRWAGRRTLTIPPF